MKWGDCWGRLDGKTCVKVMVEVVEVVELCGLFGSAID